MNRQAVIGCIERHWQREIERNAAADDSHSSAHENVWAKSQSVFTGFQTRETDLGTAFLELKDIIGGRRSFLARLRLWDIDTRFVSPAQRETQLVAAEKRNIN